MKLSQWPAGLLVAFVLGLATTASAQDTVPATPVPQEQLDSLLAPIALYPDQLLTQVLIASTYPLEVVEAARFVKANPGLKGASLDDALKDKTWDASVLSLASFPQVLDMMNEKLDWTQQLGDAFLQDEAGVMRTVQSLRERAEQAGSLQSNEQQKVVVQDKVIFIEPAQPQYVYVPVYNPTVIYGPWWWPAYRPWYWYPPPIWGYPPMPAGFAFATGFYWGTRWAIGYNNWGWARPNWNGYTININVGNNYWLNRPQYRNRYPSGSGNWNHIPEHRKGVAYRDPAISNKYRPTNAAAVQARQEYRGRPPTPAVSPTTPAATVRPTTRPAPGGSTGQIGTRPGTPAERPTTRPAPGTSPGQVGTRPTTPDRATRPLPSSPPNAAVARPAPAPQIQPRQQVQMESNRGQASRQAMNSPPQSARPSPSAGRAPSQSGRSSPGGGNR